VTAMKSSNRAGAPRPTCARITRAQLAYLCAHRPEIVRVPLDAESP
jgi:hypothetical protein